MFGTWRLILAIEVAAFHLVGIPMLGTSAVFSFFVLSGYLMTAITTRTYGFGAAGFCRFIGNRAIRLFPNYWFACVISLLVMAALGVGYTAAYKQEMSPPHTISSWTENLTMIFPAWFPNDVKPRLSPPTWALTVEWVYYLLIGIGLSRSKMTTNIWLIGSVIAALALFLFSSNHRDLYDAVYAGSLPFSAGAWTFHNRDKIAGMLARFQGLTWWHVIGAHVFFSVALVVTYLKVHAGFVSVFGNWCNIILSCLVVGALSKVKVSSGIRAIDTRIGDFSYPIYLLHWQAGAIASFLLFKAPVHGHSLRSIAAFGVALMIVSLISLVPVFLIDPFLKASRDRVRATSQASNLEGF